MRQRPSLVRVMTRAMDVLVPEASVTTAAMRLPLAVPTIVHLPPSAKSTFPLTLPDLDTVIVESASSSTL